MTNRFFKPSMEKQRQWRKKDGIGDLRIPEFGFIDDNTIIIGDEWARYSPDLLVEVLPDASAEPVKAPLTPESIILDATPVEPPKAPVEASEEAAGKVLEEGAKKEKAKKPAKKKEEPKLAVAGASIPTSSKSIGKP